MVTTILLGLLKGAGGGIIGSFFQGIMNHLAEKNRMAHECDMKRLDIEMMDKEWQYRERSAIIEGDIRMQESADNLQAASYASDAATYSSGIKVTSTVSKFMLVLVDFVRGIIRPALTCMLIWMVWEIYNKVDGKTVIMQAELYTTIITTILELASMCVAWWFGSRMMWRK